MTRNDRYIYRSLVLACIGLLFTEILTSPSPRTHTEAILKVYVNYRADDDVFDFLIFLHHKFKNKIVIITRGGGGGSILESL